MKKIIAIAIVASFVLLQNQQLHSSGVRAAMKKLSNRAVVLAAATGITYVVRKLRFDQCEEEGTTFESPFGNTAAGAMKDAAGFRKDLEFVGEKLKSGFDSVRNVFKKKEKEEGGPEGQPEPPPKTEEPVTPAGENNDQSK